MLHRGGLLRRVAFRGRRQGPVARRVDVVCNVHAFHHGMNFP